jgi:hypothetical protein
MFKVEGTAALDVTDSAFYRAEAETSVAQGKSQRPGVAIRARLLAQEPQQLCCRRKPATGQGILTLCLYGSNNSRHPLRTEAAGRRPRGLTATFP